MKFNYYSFFKIFRYKMLLLLLYVFLKSIIKIKIARLAQYCQTKKKKNPRYNVP